MSLRPGYWMQLFYLLIKIPLSGRSAAIWQVRLQQYLSECSLFQEWIDKWCFILVIHKAWRSLHRFKIHSKPDFWFLLYTWQILPLYFSCSQREEKNISKWCNSGTPSHSLKFKVKELLLYWVWVWGFEMWGSLQPVLNWELSKNVD